MYLIFDLRLFEYEHRKKFSMLASHIKSKALKHANTQTGKQADERANRDTIKAD